jgi:hypothetical protein
MFGGQLPAPKPFDFIAQSIGRTKTEGLAFCGVPRLHRRNLMADVNINEEYKAGFIEGFRSARGDGVPDPDVPPRPRIANKRKARDLGWHDGRLHGLDATVLDHRNEAG